MNSILLIEDDTQTANLLTILFDIEGIKCHLPQDFHYESIKKIILENQPDVILMDVNLKQNNGLTLIKTLREERVLNHLTKVIMTSGSDLKDECINAGANDFLLKPYMPDELLSKVKQN